MDHFLWLPLNWGIVWFVLWLVLAAILMLFVRYTGLLALTLVLYLGVSWEMWSWVSAVFWIAVIVAIIGLIVFAVRRRADGLVRAGTGIAGFIVAVLFLLSLFGAGYRLVTGGDVDALDKSFQEQLTASNEAVKTLTGKVNDSVTAQAEVDKLQDGVDAKILERLAKVEGRVTVVEGQVAELTDRVDAIDDYIMHGVTHTATPDDVSVKKTSRSIAEGLASRGWDETVKIGSVDWDANPRDTGRNVFGERVESTQELSSYLKKDSREAAAMRKHIHKAIKAEVPPNRVEYEHRRAMSGKGYVPVQFPEAVCYDGNTFYRNGEAKVPDKQTCRQAGDIFWIYVASNGEVIWDASVRADCSNPGLTKPPAPRDKVKTKKPPATKPPVTTPTPSTTPTRPVTPTPTPSKTPTSTPTPTKTPSKTPTPTPTPSKTPGKKPTDHPCNQGNCPSNTHVPAPSPTGPASTPGGGQPPTTYTKPPTPTAPAPSSTPRPSSSPSTTVDPEPSHSTVPSPTW